MWRHDDLFRTSGGTTVGTVVRAATRRALWLAEGVRGGPAPADLRRVDAMTAVRDALRHAGPPLGLDTPAALGVADRLAACRDAPPNLRGASLGLGWSLRGTAAADPVRAVRGAFVPASAGERLTGLFALAREEVLHTPGMLELLDELGGAAAGSSSPTFGLPAAAAGSRSPRTTGTNHSPRH